MQELPQKDYYKVSEVCQYTDTQPYVLRFWETEFPQLRPGKGASGQRLYRRADIEVVWRIKELLYDEEQTLDAARRKLADELSRGVRAKPRAVHAVHRVETAPAPPPVARAAEPAPALHDADVVARRRYEDAVDEIEQLRLELREADKARQRAEAATAEAQATAGRERERARRAIAYLEQLRQILS